MCLRNDGGIENKSHEKLYDKACKKVMNSIVVDFSWSIERINSQKIEWLRRKEMLLNTISSTVWLTEEEFSFHAKVLVKDPY